MTNNSELQAKLEELHDAIRKVKNVQGRYSTEIACRNLFALLPENNKKQKTTI
jgi:hypothetical protein